MPVCALRKTSFSRPPSPDARPAGLQTTPGTARNPSHRTLDRIGYGAADLEAIRFAIHAPDGLVLVVGPARSGRSTALTAMRAEFGPAGRNGAVMLLKTIATPAMAQRAVQAARAGHLVLSTMALGRAASAIDELRRLRVTAAQVLDALSLVIAQRLMARLCPECSAPDDREAVRDALAAATNTWLDGLPVRARRARPGGCAQCRQTGHSGLTLAYELIEVDARARALIASAPDPVELERALLADGHTLWDRGLQRLAEGTTSLDALRAALRSPR